MTASLLLSIAAAAWLGADDSLISDAKLESLGMYRYWQADLPLSNDDTVESAYLVDDAVYVITAGGTVFAVRADVGLIRWADRITERDYRIQRPAHLLNEDGTGPVIIPTTARSFIYDRYSGDLKASFAPGFASGGPAVGIRNRGYFGSADGRVYALLLPESPWYEPVQLWAVQTDGPVTTSPILFNGTELIFASQAGSVYSCRAVDKTLRWAVHLRDGIVADPAVDESAVYVAGLDRSVHKLAIETGRRLWRHQMPKELLTGPAVVADTVFQFCPGQGLVAIDADSGSERWRVPYGRSLISHTVNGDLVFTGHRRLLLVDHENGDVRGEIETSEVVGAVINTVHDAAYLIGRHGRVLCARLDTVPYLRRQQIIAARAQLNRSPQGEWTTEPRSRGTPVTREGRGDDPFRSRWDREP